MGATRLYGNHRQKQWHTHTHHHHHHKRHVGEKRMKETEKREGRGRVRCGVERKEGRERGKWRAHDNDVYVSQQSISMPPVGITVTGLISLKKN